jgi:hypothetical protein
MCPIRTDPLHVSLDDLDYAFWSDIEKQRR